MPKYGRTSVARNQLKRRLREIVRREMLKALPPMDITIRARREAYDASFPELKAELQRAYGRLSSKSSDLRGER